MTYLGSNLSNYLSNSPQTMPSSMENMTISSQAPSAIDLMTFLGDTLEQWQVHRCQLTQSFISQHEPMKLIYHYEHLNETVKSQYPLNGALLQQFDRLITREDFANLLAISVNEVAAPWQLKFYGKLVIYHAPSEVALRLQWTNTLKNFEPVYQADLGAAVTHAFGHWQLVDSTEIINKNVAMPLMANHPDISNAPLLQHMSQFVVLPAPVALAIQQSLHNQSAITEPWLAQMIATAEDAAATYSAVS